MIIPTSFMPASSTTPPRSTPRPPCAPPCSAAARCPPRRSLEIHPVAYLHGLGEAVGELRRRMLDRLRDGDLVAAEQCLVEMDQIVDLLAELDYPDGMTAGLRRTTDVSRALVERSRADLTTTVVQERLRAELSERTHEEA